MNWDYIAGFFDGEGNIHLNTIRDKKEENKLKGLEILCRIYNTNKEILEQIRVFLGFGNIYKKKHDVFELVISKKEQTNFFLRNIQGKTILKKGQIDYVLANYSFDRNSNLGFDVDKFRSFITRKNVEKFRKNTSNQLKKEKQNFITG